MKRALPGTPGDEGWSGWSGWSGADCDSIPGNGRVGRVSTGDSSMDSLHGFLGTCVDHMSTPLDALL